MPPMGATCSIWMLAPAARMPAVDPDGVGRTARVTVGSTVGTIVEPSIAVTVVGGVGVAGIWVTVGIGYVCTGVTASCSP